MYTIIRFYSPDTGRDNKIVMTGLTLEEAQEHCNDPDSRREGIYFDGYEEE